MKKISDNHDFVQFTREGLRAIFELESFVAHKIFIFLTGEMDRENSLIISQQTLADILEVRRETINIAVKELVEKNDTNF